MNRKNGLHKTGMWCKGRVFRSTRQGANFIVVLIALILIFKDKITGIVDDAMKNIDDDSGEILE